MAYMHKIPGLAMLVDVMRREDEQAFMAEQEAIKLAAMREEGDEERTFRSGQLGLELENRLTLKRMEDAGWDKQRASTEAIQAADRNTQMDIARMRAVVDREQIQAMKDVKEGEKQSAAYALGPMGLYQAREDIKAIPGTPKEQEERLAKFDQDVQIPRTMKGLSLFLGNINMTKVERETFQKTVQRNLMAGMADPMMKLPNNVLNAGTEKLKQGLGLFDSVRYGLEPGMMAETTDIPGVEIPKRMNEAQREARASSMKLHNAFTDEELKGVKDTTEALRKDASTLLKIFQQSQTDGELPSGFGIENITALAKFYEVAGSTVSNAPEADFIRKVLTSKEDKDLRELFILARRLSMMQSEQRNESLLKANAIGFGSALGRQQAGQAAGTREGN